MSKYSEDDDAPQYTYFFEDEARLEYIEAIKYYLDNGGKEIAEKFALKVDTVIEMLEMWPEAGRVLEAIPEIRSSLIPKFPYRLYYRIDHDRLEVIGLSVYHSKRDIEKLTPKLKARISK